MHTTELDVLRRDAEAHNLDVSRVRIVPDEGSYLVAFPQPVVALGPWGEHVPTGTVRCRTAAQAEETMLRGMIRLTVAERQRIRVGHVVGWDSCRINRCPLSDDEIAAYKARLGHATTVARLQSELAEALAAQATRESTQRGTADLSERYGLAVAPVQSTEHPTLSGKPAKRPRASRKEVNHE
ncbi:hypothetical protein [Pseudomonas plecoglossicida]|uniref:hypothetical protein n=1 Tax=Pseudomonas plecoglossicida TaxID=70775 RepID=UPI00051CEF44|nr:hypothetical protein [Pseudomonas plecoglossicida]KGK24276.1 hypothetical protein GT93_05215 [Pseudomonas plecoglossicida]